MSRQGKMHGSPFHIETVQYKYAVEHEVTPISNELISCPHFDHRTKYCKLWNSGQQVCRAYKCKFYLKKTDIQSKCSHCAFFYNHKCRHRFCENGNIEENAAAYCCFYIGKEQQTKRYKRIHRRIEIDQLSSRIHLLSNRITACEKYIEKAMREIHSPKVGEKEKAYFKAKVAQKQLQKDEARKKLKPLIEQRATLIKKEREDKRR